MSLSPVTPNFTQNLQGYTPKSFWKRPEGPFGIAALVALIIAGGIGLYEIMPYIISLLTDTIHAVALAAVLVAILWLAVNPTFRTAVSNLRILCASSHRGWWRPIRSVSCAITSTT